MPPSGPHTRIIKSHSALATNDYCTLLYWSREHIRVHTVIYNVRLYEYTKANSGRSWAHCVRLRVTHCWRESLLVIKRAASHEGRRCRKPPSPQCSSPCHPYHREEKRSGHITYVLPLSAFFVSTANYSLQHGVRHGQKFGRANTEYIVYNNYNSL